jgi:predicted MFS family arabinose efflux permease
VSETRKPPAVSWWLLLFLIAVHSCNWMDRYLATILMEPMKRDLHLSDAQLGLITGLGFSLVYSLTALPNARMVDRGQRKFLLSAFVGLWSGATMLASMATGFASLAASRVVVAAAESGCSPAAYSLISDSFPARLRGRAVSLYALGVPFGAWAGLSLGGFVNDLVGWRATFLLIGAPGLALALIAATLLRDPPRGGYDSKTVQVRAFSLVEALDFMRRSPAFVLSCVSIGLIAISTSGFQGWVPAYLMREHGASSSMAGALAGAMSGIGGIIGALLVGLFADILARRDPRWYLWLPMIGAAVLIPAQQIFLRTECMVSYVFYFVAILAGGTYTAPMFTLCRC